MFEILQALIDPRVLTMVLAAIAAGATVITLAMPLLVKDTLSTRMKAVAFEREKIRQRERERLAQGSKVTLRQSPKAYMQTVVENFNLNKWVGQETARALLVQAGYRGPRALRDLSVFPHDHASRDAAGFAILRVCRHPAR